MTQFPLFALDVYNTKVAYTVTLNGFPVDDSPGNANGHFSSTRVGEYVADGQNTFAVHLAAPAPKFLSGFAATVRATGGQELYTYEWDPNAPHHPPLPVQAQAHFTAHLPHGPWAWQTAPKITLDAPTKAAISASIKRLHDALDRKNVEESVALFAPRNRAYGASQGKSAAEADKDSRDGWGEEFAKPGWHLIPIDYPHLRYELIAGGRVVHVTRSDSGRPLMGAVPEAGGSYTGYDLFLCLVHGQWTLIR